MKSKLCYCFDLHVLFVCFYFFERVLTIKVRTFRCGVSLIYRMTDKLTWTMKKNLKKKIRAWIQKFVILCFSVFLNSTMLWHRTFKEESYDCGFSKSHMVPRLLEAIAHSSAKNWVSMKWYVYLIPVGITYQWGKNILMTVNAFFSCLVREI